MEAAVAAQTGNSDGDTFHTINEKGAVPLELGDEESIIDVLKTRNCLVGQKHDLSIALAAGLPYKIVILVLITTMQ